MRVCDYYGFPLGKGEVGIEVEVEGVDLPKAIEKYWRVERDGSLRGESAEYVLAEPKSVAVANKAIHHLSNAFKEHNSILNFSHRTSVHVHINVRNLNRDQLVIFCFLALLFDNSLVRIGARDIKGNRFCLRIIDAEGQLKWLENQAKSQAFIIPPDEAHSKYASVNMCPIRSYGSVEFRSMKGNMDVDLLTDWVMILYRIKEVCFRYKNLQEIASKLLKDEVEFTKEVFGPFADRFICDELYDELRQNYSLMIGIVHESVFEQKKAINKQAREELFEMLPLI